MDHSLLMVNVDNWVAGVVDIFDNQEGEVEHTLDVCSSVDMMDIYRSVESTFSALLLPYWVLRPTKLSNRG